MMINAINQIGADISEFIKYKEPKNVTIEIKNSLYSRAFITGFL